MKIYWDGKSKNIIGSKVRQLRTEKGLTQKALAAKLQLAGFEFSDLTILRIENGTRFVPDYELRALAQTLQVSYSYLLD
ncbi:MAG: helix-turn-helix transcriptional regulator [Oscillospiraceae bacterium]